MNKSELIASIAEKSNLSKADAGRALDAFVETVTEALSEREKVQLVGFGTFDTRDRKAREGRNPRDPKQTIHIPKSVAPVFKAGKNLKDAVNN